MVVCGPPGPTNAHGRDPSGDLAPRDERDPFCTCPKCGLLGNHCVGVETFRKRAIPGADGEPVDVSRIEDPPDGTRRAVRTCSFCGHVWRTHAEQALGAT